MDWGDDDNGGGRRRGGIVWLSLCVGVSGEEGLSMSRLDAFGSCLPATVLAM